MIHVLQYKQGTHVHLWVGHTEVHGGGVVVVVMAGVQSVVVLPVTSETLRESVYVPLCALTPSTPGYTHARVWLILHVRGAYCTTFLYLYLYLLLSLSVSLRPVTPHSPLELLQQLLLPPDPPPPTPSSCN